MFFSFIFSQFTKVSGASLGGDFPEGNFPGELCSGALFPWEFFSWGFFLGSIFPRTDPITINDLIKIFRIF